MKYTYKFEEVYDSRKEAIENLKSAIEDHKLTISAVDEYQKKHKINKLDNLKKELENNIEKFENTIKSYEEKNVKSLELINIFKEEDEEINSIVEDVLDEIGIFNTPEQK